MNAYQHKSLRAGRAAGCALALALVCGLPAGKAHAEYFPEGRGHLDVSVLASVIPVVDPDAELHDVVVHVSNDTGDHLEDAQVEIVVVPPNAEGYDPAKQPQALAARGASHALSASGSTSGDGCVLLPDVAVGSTCRVEAFKEGHESFEGRFSCLGVDGETWEVTLTRVLEPPPPGALDDGTTAAGDRAAGPGAPETAAASFTGSGQSFEAAVDVRDAAGADAADRAARPVRGFMGLATDTFPYWLVLAGVAAIALTAGFLRRARRIGKEDAAHE